MDITKIQLLSACSVTDPARIRALLYQFNRKFPSEKDCLDEIVKRTSVKYRACLSCNGTTFEKKFNGRVYRCSECKLETWILAGTIFARIRKPRAWLAAIWFLEHGIILSSSKFHLLLKVAQSTALHILKTLAKVVADQMTEFPPINSEMPPQIVCKRSRETPARAHPITEQIELESESFLAETNVSNVIELPALDEQEKEVYKLLSYSIPFSADELSLKTTIPFSELNVILVKLEIYGLAKRMPWGFLRSNKTFHRMLNQSSNEASLQISALENTFIDFVKIHFHGVSRKYLQFYLATFWCVLDRERWGKNALLAACVEAAPVSYDQILNYISPLQLKIPA